MDGIELVFHTTSGASCSGPRSTSLNVVTALLMKRKDPPTKLAAQNRIPYKV